MHITGKILIWLIVLGAIVPLVLTSKAVTYRNSWTKQIEDLREKNEKKQQDIVPKERTLVELRGELSRTMLAWERYWDKIEAGAAGGIIAAQGTIGTNFGFGMPAGKDLPVVHMFMPDPEGGSRYVGAFQPPDQGSIRETQVALRPIRPLRPGEDQAWAGAAAGWRCWTKIPAAYERRFSDLYLALADTDMLLVDRQENLEKQNQFEEFSKKQLDDRLQELLGPPDPKELDGDAKIDHYLIGLVKAIELEEKRRNAAQAEVDRLRREMKAEEKRLQELIESIREAARKLAQPAQPRTADAGKN